MNGDTNWLRVGRITCPTCQSDWHRVDRSTMEDDWRVYCNHCDTSVEVSYCTDLWEPE